MHSPQLVKMHCKWQRTALMVTCVLLAFGLSSTANAFPAEELGQTLGLSVDLNSETDNSKVTPPAFLNELYECWSSSTSARAAGCPSREEFSEDKHTKVDLIRSFVGKYDADSPPAVQSYNRDVELSNSMAIVFNSSCSMHHKEAILGAEIRIYKFAVSEIQLEDRCPGITSNGVDVQLYTTLGTTGTSDVAQFVKQVTLTKEELATDGFVVFKNLTQLYRDSFGKIFNRTHNHSVTIRIALAAPCSGINPIQLGFTAQEGKEATITGFSKSGPSPRSGMATLSLDAGSRHQRHAASGEDYEHYLPRPLTLLQGERCKLHSYRISFEDLGWEEYVIKPTRYDANICIGRCDMPLRAIDNTTRHSYIQAIVSAYNPNTVPEPCCIPSNLEPLIVVYREAEDLFTLLTWDDMRATHCGCR